MLRFLPPLAIVLLSTQQFGCYKPNIQDGGFLCNVDAGANACPEGYKCEMQSKKCYRNPDAGVDKVDVRDVPETSDVDTGTICIDEPVPGCTPGSGMCDPACRTGCECPEKCSVNANGALTCNRPRMQGYPKILGQDCTIESAGAAVQTDNCGPSLVCIEDGCFSRCFQFCKSNADCPGSSCTREIGGGQRVCDVPFVDTCVPLGGTGSNTGCTGTNMACYLSSAAPTHTICDCPMGAGFANADCTRTRDCFPGLACVDRQTGASPKCLQVCRLSDNGADCPGSTPGSCLPYKGIPPGTASHPTFGYCF